MAGCDQFGKKEKGVLAEGGSVELRFVPALWSPGFDFCTDGHGVPLEVNAISHEGPTHA